MILSKNQSSATLWVLDTCLIVGLLPFDDHFDHCFVIFKDVQLRLALRRMCVCGYIIHITQPLSRLPSFDIQGLGFGIQSRTSFLGCWYAWVGQCCWLIVILQSPRPKDQEQVNHPFVIRHPEKESQTLWNRARQHLVSCTSN